MTDKLSIKREESPIISGIEELLYAITGQPAFCASTTGIPNPSYAEGYNKQKALLYNIFSFYYYGLVAQMVDRRLGMAEAPGSNPGQSIYKFSKNKF